MKTDELKYDLPKYRRALLIKGWTQMELAERSGLKPSKVSEFLNGKYQGPRTAKVIADTLGLRMKDVVLEGVA